MGRAPCCDKANVKKGPWSPEEDFKLKSYIQNYGTGNNWIALPHKIGLKRCGKSCRLRWLNYLRPNIKHGGFTREEDYIICSLYITIGTRWSIIAAQLPGRTDNDIKNYWNTKLKKKLLGRHRNSPISAQNLNNLSSSALERLELHMHLYNNTAPFWPQLQQRMIETLNSFNQNPHIFTPAAPPPLQPDHTMNCSQIPPPIQDSDFVGFVNQAVDNDEFDCFKEMDGGAKGDVAWWCNEFEANSNSWESTAVVRRSDEEMYGDHVMGYRM